MSNKKPVNKDKNTYITERIESFRGELKLSKTKFCKEINYSNSNYGNISAKKRFSKPSLELLTLIADKYPGLNFNWLITGQGEMFNTPSEVLAPSQETTILTKPTQNTCPECGQDLNLREQLIKSLKETIEAQFGPNV